ncbi:MAG TPA: SIMPL domain-containing protein [Gemmatimonadaceae bacterium]|jgi:uncharacterized protein YggE|nr:SIMPL domain-containing protein [Gemmatimonadaceae bacterium]
MCRLVHAAFARFLAAVTLTAGASSPMSAQTGTVPSSPPPPHIAATAVGEARVTPDRAMLHVAVESQGESAAAAAATNAAKQTKVIDAVKAAGVAAAQIRTSGYNVYPEYTHDGKRAPRVTGYRATNTVQVEIRTIADVGKVIDAALGAGATNVGSLQLYPSTTDAARREAVQQAVSKARAEAETGATAAGGSLGTLLDLTIDPIGLPQPLGRVMMTGAASVNVAMPTPIETGESVVTAVVRVRWQFVPGQR